jgi:hypothetical protein
MPEVQGAPTFPGGDSEAVRQRAAPSAPPTRTRRVFFLGGRYGVAPCELQRGSTHLSEKGTEYELDFEDDFRTIASSERLFRSFAMLASIDWSKSDDRAVRHPRVSRPQSSNRFRSGIVLALVLGSLFRPII